MAWRDVLSRLEFYFHGTKKHICFPPLADILIFWNIPGKMKKDPYVPDPIFAESRLVQYWVTCLDKMENDITSVFCRSIIKFEGKIV